LNFGHEYKRKLKLVDCLLYLESNSLSFDTKVTIAMVMEYQNIIKNFGRELHIKKIEAIVSKVGLTGVAEIKGNDFTGIFCFFRLPKNDPRIKAFFDELELNEIPTTAIIKSEMVPEVEDIDNSELMILEVTVMPLSNPSKEQKYSTRKACTNCGSGLEINPPLLVPRNEMNTSPLKMTGHNLWLVLDKRLSEYLVQEGLSGIEFGEAHLGREKMKYVFAHTPHVLPKLSKLSKFRRQLKKCPNCDKAGNFDPDKTSVELVYDKSNLGKKGFMDFNRTYECFGEWDYTRLGGARRLIITQKARQALLNFNVPFLRFTPIRVI
jgi:hypothetical protein